MGGPHVLIIAYPAQGHVIPLMELAQWLVKHGFKITFVNSELTHKRVVNALTENDNLGDQIRMVPIRDAMEARNLEDLIQQLDESAEEGSKISCIIADQGLPWAMDVAAKLGIRGAAFLPAAAALFVLGLSIPKLIEDGIIGSDGTPTKNQLIQLSPTMPGMNTQDFVWARFGSSEMKKKIFELAVRGIEILKLADWLICNSSYEVETGAFTAAPQLLPIGPLLAANRLGSSKGLFWPQDPTCLAWLDQHPTCSVIYVAFGSSTVFSQAQFEEIAHGLELTGRPFLWAVRPGIVEGSGIDNDVYQRVFLDRVGGTGGGMVVSWAPQQKVLSHASVACFMSHCGWNSTMEGVSNGVPFLCCPYIADQFVNETYICDVWKVGLRFERDKRGIIDRGEVKNKVEQLLGDDGMKARALNLKEMTVNSVREGGSSNKNFNNFVEWMKS